MIFLNDIREWEGKKVLCIKAHDFNNIKYTKDRFYEVFKVHEPSKCNKFTERELPIWIKTETGIKCLSLSTFIRYFTLKSQGDVRREKIKKLLYG